MAQFAESLKQLSADNINLLKSIGEEQVISKSTILIRKNSQIGSLYFVINGLFSISNDLSKKTITLLGAGEIIGGVSFMGNKIAPLTVTATEDSLVLAIPFDKLQDFISANPSFGVQLYQALGQIIANQLRVTADKVEELWNIDELYNRINPLCNHLLSGINDFKELISVVDKRAIANKGIVCDEDKHQVSQNFEQLYMEFNTLFDQKESIPEPLLQKIGQIVKKEFLPLMLLTSAGERFYAKPRGYAGDFYTIEMVYRNQPEGYGRLGPVLDQCFLNLPAAKAVRNRRSILYREILKTINEKNEGTANIMSIACGPSREIMDVLQSTSGEKALKATLLDFDLKALSFVDEELDNLDLKKNVELVNENILLLISGRKKLLIEKQDFIYSIGLIDYFSDRIVIKLLDYIHSILHENGRVMVGNFHPQNPTKAFMDYVLEWPLIHRSEEDMNRLFMSSKFQRPCDKIIFEEEGINLFVECRKLEDD